jgi:hypothetical protein
VVTVSSSDTEEALELLSLGPCHDLASPVSSGNIREPSSSSGSELFEDWPEANDIMTSVYVALTMEALSSLASMADAARGRQKSHNTNSSTRHCRSETVPSQQSRRRKPKSDNVSRKKSKKTKKSVIDDGSTEALLRGRPLSMADFDPSEWEIMYLCFIEEGLIDPPDRVHK